MFATLILEQEFLSFGDLPALLDKWLFVVGGMGLVFALGFLLRDGVRFALGKRQSYLFEGFAGRLPGNDPIARFWRLRTFWLFHLVAVIGVLLWLTGLRWLEDAQGRRTFAPFAWYRWGVYTALLSGVMILTWEFLIDLAQLSVRRIWAIARLSIKEALRRKALLSFLVILGIFLFASWFIQADQAKNQWRIYVNLVFFVMTGLLLITASVLACFSLPTDIRRQTIHTIVTKPVQKFEIILGRVLGYGLLMTVVLAVVATASLFYVVREIDEKARTQTMRARQFLKGDLRFWQLDQAGNMQPLEREKSVLRPWDYRQYIRGGSTQVAVWTFDNVPPQVKQLKRVPVDFSFDIYRMSKGGRIAEQGVQCQFNVRNTGHPKLAEYLQNRPTVNAATGKPYEPDELAKEFGFYQLKVPKVFDERSADFFTFPGELLEGVENGRLEIRVTCESPGQYLGMARYDLYIRSGEGNFFLNYFKGVAGIWFLIVLVIGVGVVLSTYLSALVSLLFTWMLMFCGIHRIRTFIAVLTLPPEAGANPGGGPFEAAYRLFREENLTKKLERTRGVEAIEFFDNIVRMFFRVLLSILPDLNQYDRTIFVAEGFNIAGGDLGLNCIMLAGYLFPFLLLGYYLLNGREVAGAT